MAASATLQSCARQMLGGSDFHQLVHVVENTACSCEVIIDIKAARGFTRHYPRIDMQHPFPHAVLSRLADSEQSPCTSMRGIKTCTMLNAEELLSQHVLAKLSGRRQTVDMCRLSMCLQAL